MYVTCVHVKVKADHVAEFIQASEKNHACSIEESGNCRFDVLQSLDDPTTFVLYEAYASKADAAAHKETEHYLKWRETVADWMAEPRNGISYNSVAP